MERCGKCGKGGTIAKRIEQYEYAVGGMSIELFDSALEIQCPSCHATAVFVPNLLGLSAAVAIARVQEPTKLNGKEIRFLRKALALTARELAARIDVTAETVSRWEADRVPIKTQNEMILRLLVASLLAKSAPAMNVDIEGILKTKIVPFRNTLDNESMSFELVRMKDQGRKEKHWDTIEPIAA